MSQNSFVIPKSDIRRELDNVRRLADEAKEWRPRLEDWPYTVRVRTAGGILHDFYSAAERVFRHIANEIDGDLPSGSSWHIQLLQRMATDLETIRPAVIDSTSARQLGKYLRRQRPAVQKHQRLPLTGLQPGNGPVVRQGD